MTIERGASWGDRGALAADGVIAHSDAEVRAVVERARRETRDLPPIGLLGGDLHKTLGGIGGTTEDRLRSGDAMTFTVDLGVVLVDGRIHLFVSHLVARRSWWRGRVIAVMNGQWIGRWDAAPRSHPNDGLLDVTEGDLALADRLKARRRLPTGTHLPHPDLRTSRVAACQFELQPTLDVWLDGELLGRARNLSVRVEPDALTVVV